VNQRGVSEWEPIKILLEGDEGSNKMDTTSNTRLRLNYPSWSRPRSHWSATNPMNQQTTFRAKHTNTHSGNLHGLLPVLHRSDRWHAPIRLVHRAGQAGGCSSRTTNVPESLSDFSRPWNQNTPKHTTCTEGKPNTNLARQHQTDQELTSNSLTQRHTDLAAHPRQIPRRVHTG
jgi:hypothetical protein